MSPPVFLEGYDVFAKLTEWMEQGPKEQERHWMLGAWKKRFIRCILTWNLDGQCAAIEKVTKHIEESVWMALEEFAKWERKYNESESQASKRSDGTPGTKKEAKGQ